MQVRFSSVVDATSYEVMRGALDQISANALEVSLGPLDCLYSGPASGVVTSIGDASIPLAGEAYFYLFAAQPADAEPFGTSSADLVRVGAANCPPAAP